MENGKGKAQKVQLDPDIAHLEKVFQMGAEVGIGLAALYIARGDDEAAVRYYNEVLEEDPYNISARAELGHILFRLGRDEEAEAQYRRVLQYDTSDNAMIMHNLGIILWRRGEEKESCRLFEGALKRDPYFYASYFALMEIYERQGNHRKAAGIRKRFAKASQRALRSEERELEEIKEMIKRTWNELRQERI